MRFFYREQHIAQKYTAFVIDCTEIKEEKILTPLIRSYDQPKFSYMTLKLI